MCRESHQEQRCRYLSQQCLSPGHHLTSGRVLLLGLLRAFIRIHRVVPRHLTEDCACPPKNDGGPTCRTEAVDLPIAKSSSYRLIYTHTCIYVYVYMYTRIYIYIYVSLALSLSLYTHAYTHLRPQSRHHLGHALLPKNPKRAGGTWEDGRKRHNLAGKDPM